MRTYELMLILTPETDPTDTKKITETVNKLLGVQAKSVEKVEIIGKKRLSYPIRKLSEGVYVLAKLKSERIDLAPIEKTVRLIPEVLRHMVSLVKE
jgi:small subunit ribosomal protein S6